MNDSEKIEELTRILNEAWETDDLEKAYDSYGDAGVVRYFSTLIDKVETVLGLHETRQVER